MGLQQYYAVAPLFRYVFPDPTCADHVHHRRGGIRNADDNFLQSHGKRHRWQRTQQRFHHDLPGAVCIPTGGVIFE